MAEPPQEKRRDKARDQRRERRVARGRSSRCPQHAKHHRGGPEQSDQHPDIDRDALAALELEPDREEVTEEGAEAGDKKPEKAEKKEKK